MSSKANHIKLSHRSSGRHYGGARARLIASRASRYDSSPTLAGMLRRFRAKILPQKQRAGEEAETA